MPHEWNRSRSPHRTSQSHSHGQSHSHSHSHKHRHHRARSRSRSPHRSRHAHKHAFNNDTAHDETPKPLPLNAAPVTRHALDTYRPLFALYLDVQKQLDIEDLAEDEVKGRWKSFVKKWNAGDLAEGWYDTKTFEKATRGTFGIREQGDQHTTQSFSEDKHTPPFKRKRSKYRDEDDEDDDDDFGPSLPTDMINSSTSQAQSAKAGPSIPSATEIRLRNEQSLEDADNLRSNQVSQTRTARQLDRKDQRDRLEELAPRAEPGTRERQLEKRRENAAANRAFAGAKEAGGDVELRDADVMGEADSLGELKRMKENEQRKKTEREIRREEILRARTAEREERLKGMREKEAKTMEMLKSIARARFGGGGVNE